MFRGSYIQGFLHPGVLTIRGFLRPGVLRLYKEGKLSKGVFVKSRGRCYIEGYAQLLIMIRLVLVLIKVKSASGQVELISFL